MGQQQKSSSSQAEIIDQKIHELDHRSAQISAQIKKKQNLSAYQERQKRAHRLIGIGAETEYVMGRLISKEELPAFREYLEKAKDIMGAF